MIFRQTILIAFIFGPFISFSQSGYKLPYACGEAFFCTSGNSNSCNLCNHLTDSESQYAFDFGMAIGTPIVAMRAGTVIVVEEDFDSNCPFPNCWCGPNRIVIDHGDGTRAQYLHLNYLGAIVYVGQSVLQGQHIGYSGNTGCISGSGHLHVMVMNDIECDSLLDWNCQSIEIAFDDVIGGVPNSNSNLPYISLNSSSTCYDEEYNDIIYQAQMLSAGESIQACIGSNESHDWYQYELSGNGLLTIYITDIVSDDLHYEITDNNGNNIDSYLADNSDLVQFEICNAPICASYYLHVWSDNLIECARSYVISSTFNGNSNCNSNQSPLLLQPPPNLIVSPEILTICQGHNAQFTATAGYANYIWEGSDGSTHFGQNITVNPLTNVTYSLSAVFNCEHFYASADAIVSPVPIVTLSEEFVVLSYGQSIQLSAFGADTYTWNPSTGLDNSNIANPIAAPSQNITYTVVGTNAENCQDSEQITIFVQGIGLNPPTNDECEGAIQLEVEAECATQIYTLSDANTSEVTIPFCDSPGNVDVWFTFTVPASGYISLFTANQTIPSGDLGAAFYAGDCSEMQEVRCVKDGNGAMPFDENINLVDYAGQQMFIRIWEYGDEISQGDFSICLYTEPLFPENVIVAFEYWYDSDYVNRRFHYVNPSPVLNLITSFETDELSKGLHVLHFRSMDNYGKWSSTLSRFINKASTVEAEIIGYEYWFDDNYFALQFVYVEPSQNLDIIGSLNCSAIEDGLHILHFRAKDNNGQWSSTLSRFIHKVNFAASPNVITGFEYWFDENYTNKIAGTILTTENPYTYSQNISATNLDLGGHDLRIRFKDSGNQWSTVHSIPFVKIAQCLGDFDLNLTVNVGDLLFFTSGFGCTNDCGIVDLTADGVVNVSDLLVFMSIFGEDCE